MYMHVFGGSVCTCMCLEGVCVHGTCVGGSVCSCACLSLEGVCVSRFGGSMYTCVQGQDRVHVHACVCTWFGRSVYIHDCAGLTFVCSVHVDLFN